MKTKILSILLVGMILLTSSGCSGTWRKKFVRKKKDEDIKAPVLQPYDYEKEFTNKQSYANHFAFWKNAESELITAIKTSSSMKRVDMYASYSQKEINEIYALLIEEKQKELKPFLDQLDEITRKIKIPNYIKSHRNAILKDLGRHYRAVGKFAYFFMQNYVRPDEDIKDVKTAEE